MLPATAFHVAVVDSREGKVIQEIGGYDGNLFS